MAKKGKRQSDVSAALESRLEALEARLARLEERDPDAPTAAPRSDDPASAAPPSRATGSTADRDPFFALHALQDNVPAPGAVLYTGSVDLPQGHLEYQWARPTSHLLDTDWAERAETLAALGHPLRLAMLRSLLDGERTVAQLVDDLELASTGVAYHHLNQLQGAGWVTSPRRGVWAVPPGRTIPLLAIITATETA